MNRLGWPLAFVHLYPLLGAVLSPHLAPSRASYGPLCSLPAQYTSDSVSWASPRQSGATTSVEQTRPVSTVSVLCRPWGAHHLSTGARRRPWRLILQRTSAKIIARFKRRSTASNSTLLLPRVRRSRWISRNRLLFFSPSAMLPANPNGILNTDAQVLSS
ncbi:hypothetical protein B0H16DRAFT_709795 [Mycena metata]|uniref:Secreted protein n=1 Tax=Mycena metata TaxID=1033252 RepID=A0AAD7GTX9_9AGAR|nr:hypothetical protein B0H16DRAFT_709795 [Mycena metata]